MKDRVLMMQGLEHNKQRDMEASEGLGLLKSLPSNPECIASRIESQKANRKRTGDE